jgi:hypothetical protein
MAKVQTFADKLKKKKLEEQGINVKVIKGNRTETGSMGFFQKFVNIKDMSEIDNIDITK